MATSQLSEVVQHLRTALLLCDGAGLTDEQLLDRFVARRDETAFASLVRRHGVLVWGVCRRVLGNVHDAEDAFQATFLVLARKASAIVRRELLANWLYGVAYNTAIKARALIARQRSREKQVTQMPEPEAVKQDLWPELLPLLDQELSRLPEKYRVPIVLCELEGKSRKEAAQRLAVPEGTVASRLARARTLLARRLARYGVFLSAGGLLSGNAASARVPTTLEIATVKAATLFAAGETSATGVISTQVAAITEGVLKTMFLTKLKCIAAILLAIGLVSGAGVLVHQVLAEKPADPAAKEKLRPQGKEATTELTGVVQSVDAAKNTLTLTGKQFGSKTFDVAREAKIYLEDGSGGRLGFKDGKLADIGEGFIVTVRLSEDRSKVLGLFAEGPSVRGNLKSVDAAKRTITVTFADKKSDPEQDRTFEVSRTVAISISDSKPKDKSSSAESKLEDLPMGAVVTLKLSADQKIVSYIQAEGPDIHGIVKAVDAGKGTVTIKINDGKHTVERTFAVPPAAAIAINDGKEKKRIGSAKLADLPVGVGITLKLSLDQKTVLSVSARGLSITGIVKAVDATKNTLVVTFGRGKGEPAEEKTLDVPGDVTVRIDGKESKLADLPTEAVVTVSLAVDEKTVGSIQAEGRGVSGVVKAVDAGQSSITLAADKRMEEQTYSVRKDAPIRIDGKPGKLADVNVEAVATAKLTADGKGIVSLGISGPSVQGVLKAVDADKGKITVSVRVSKIESEEKVFDLVKNVSVTTGKFSVPLKLADLKGEKAVVLLLSADQKSVVRITVSEE